MAEIPDDRLLHVARAIADGEEVSWDSLDREEPGAVERLERLRDLERLVRAHRSAWRDDVGEERAAAEPAFRWGPLDVYERIGEGAFGEVYRAVERRLSREVALKLHRRDQSHASPRELLDEARRLARIRHPNVLVVFGADVHDGRVGVWMELVDGESLNDRLETGGPLEAEALARLGVDLSRALAAVHAAGLLHGDIKASNVLVSSDGRTLLADFGSGSDATAGSAWFSSGSPVNMAPELLAGAPPTAGTDVYALGALLHRLATGRDRVTGDTLEELLKKQRAGATTTLLAVRPSFPAALANVIERMVDADPETRLATASDVESALLAAIAELSPRDATTPTSPDASSLHNLPLSVTSFVGREREKERLLELLETVSLVTIHGPGGSGKTRLALEVARASLSRFADGVWFVDLAPVSEPGRVAETVATTLGVPSGSAVTKHLADFCSYRSLLLVLDNCERVVTGCASLVASLTEAAGGLRILVTSRELLGVASESPAPLSSLSVPDDDDDTIAHVESVVLFRDRARSATTSFEIDATTSALVADITRRLDGIPLAIELAAAQLSTQSLHELHRSLSDRPGLLTSGSRATRPRHRTLDALIAWSYELLSEDHQALLRRLSTFSGGWTLEAAERVCGGEDLPASEVSEMLDELCRKSLVERVTRRDRRGSKRYRLLAPVREYFAGRLTPDELADVRERHRDYFASFADRAVANIEGADQLDWLARLRDDHDNVRAALDAAESPSCDPEVALRLTHGAARFWEINGHWDEGLTRIQAALARAPEGPTPLLARLLAAAGGIARFAGHLEIARNYYQRSLDVGRELDDALLEANATNGLAIIADKTGDGALAETYARRAIELVLTVGERDQSAAYHNTLGVILFRRSDHEAGVAEIEKGVAIARRTHRPYLLALGLDNLASALMKSGDSERAEAIYREALGLMRAIEDPRGVPTVANNLGILLYNAGRRDEAMGLIHESLRLKYRHGNRLGVAYSLETILQVAADHEQHETVIVLHEAVRRLRETISEPSVDQVMLDRRAEGVEEALGDERVLELRSRARQMSLREVVELAAEVGP